MIKNRKINPQSGDTLIEVVIVALIITLSLVALVSLSTLGLSRNRLAKQRTVANRLAQEGMEWLRYERDRMGATAFGTIVGSVERTYCLDESVQEGDPFSGTMEIDSDDECDVEVEDVLYRRVVDMVETGNTITASVQVTWPAGNEVVVNGAFNRWQR